MIDGGFSAQIPGVTESTRCWNERHGRRSQAGIAPTKRRRRLLRWRPDQEARSGGVSAASSRRAREWAPRSCAERQAVSRDRRGRACPGRRLHARLPRQTLGSPARRRARSAPSVSPVLGCRHGNVLEGAHVGLWARRAAPISRTGARASEAFAIAVTVLVTPGLMLNRDILHPSDVLEIADMPQLIDCGFRD
jgi:hypothetical protein